MVGEQSHPATELPAVLGSTGCPANANPAPNQHFCKAESIKPQHEPAHREQPTPTSAHIPEKSLQGWSCPLLPGAPWDAPVRPHPSCLIPQCFAELPLTSTSLQSASTDAARSPKHPQGQVLAASIELEVRAVPAVTWVCSRDGSRGGRSFGKGWAAHADAQAGRFQGQHAPRSWPGQAGGQIFY